MLHNSSSIFKKEILGSCVTSCSSHPNKLNRLVLVRKCALSSAVHEPRVSLRLNIHVIRRLLVPYGCFLVRGPTHITQTDIWVSRRDTLSLLKRRGDWISCNWCRKEVQKSREAVRVEFLPRLLKSSTHRQSYKPTCTCCQGERHSMPQKKRRVFDGYRSDPPRDGTQLRTVLTPSGKMSWVRRVSLQPQTVNMKLGCSSARVRKRHTNRTTPSPIATFAIKPSAKR